MKILVVDDDPVAQRIMKMFVEKSGYKPTIIPDGKMALEAALAPEAPPIILLDWMLPVMDGIAVLKKIREAKPKVRPYVIMLSAKHGKEEIAMGLDAGADDFVSKPFNVVEMQARLRVANRLVEYQHELLKHIHDIEVLSQRNSLLGELISKQQDAEAPLQPVAAAKLADSTVQKEPGSKPVVFTDQEARYILSIALLEMRLALQKVKPRGFPPEFHFGEFCGWSGLMFHEHDLWLDLVMVGDSESSGTLFERSLGRKSQGETETLGFLAELSRMIAISFGRLLKVRAGEVAQPLMSRALRLSMVFNPLPVPQETRSYELVVGGLPFKLMTAVESCGKRLLAPVSVDVHDVLAAPFPPSEASSVPIFNQGVVMTPRYIEKLLSHEVAEELGDCVAVRRPTKLARYFAA